MVTIPHTARLCLLFKKAPEEVVTDGYEGATRIYICAVWSEITSFIIESINRNKCKVLGYLPPPKLAEQSAETALGWPCGTAESLPPRGGARRRERSALGEMVQRNAISLIFLVDAHWV